MEKPNIVLVVFDTLNWDCFHKLTESDPLFNKQVEDFTNFNMAFSPSPWTLPSHFSLFTGLYPSEHGIHETKDSELDEIFQKARNYSGEFISKIASLSGYRTVGISENPMISYLTGVEENFDEFYNVDLGELSGLRISKPQSHNRNIRRIQYIKSRTIANLRGYPKNKGYKITLSFFSKFISSEPFFIFINFMEMHDPYHRTIWIDDNLTILNDLFAVKPLKAKYIDKLRNQYCHQVEKVKESILQLITCLKKEKKYDNTIVIITSDHGQALKENGYYGHGTFLYDELIHIPLLIKLPMIYSQKVNPETYINLVDIHGFLRAIITEEDDPYKYLKRDKTFSEAFGLQYSKSSLTSYLQKTKGKEIYDRINVARKVIIKSGEKLCLNAKSEIEEFYSYFEANNGGTNSNHLDDLLFNIDIFNINKDFIIDSQAIKKKIVVEKNGQKI